MISTLFSMGIALWPLLPHALHRAWRRLTAAPRPCTANPVPGSPPRSAGGSPAAGNPAARPGRPQ